ncbi:hypothetical protein ES706_05183 [subsurface metagenome]
MPDKLKSRKFWNAVVGEIAGLVALFCGLAQGEMVAIIAGAVLTIAVTLGYLKAEKDIDVARLLK